MKRKFKVITTTSNHNFDIAPNRINRDFYSSNPNDKYVGDITYIKTKQGTMYLATVIDLYSRKVVGWSMDDTMKVSLVNDALLMAIKRRNPSEGLIWHTDRGSQYLSKEYRKYCKENKLELSYSRKGNPYDNACIESFHATLKKEYVHHKKFKNLEEIRIGIFEYIESWYNRKRIQEKLGYLSPVEYEEQLKNEIKINRVS